MSSTIATPRSARPIAWNRLLIAGLIALVAAVVANALVYLIASSLGTFFQSYINPQLGRPIGLGDVVSTTIVGAIGATIVLALLNLFTRRPAAIFRWIALVVMLLSFATPFTLPGAPISLVITLELMHIVAAVVITYVLISYSRSR